MDVNAGRTVALFPPPPSLYDPPPSFRMHLKVDVFAPDRTEGPRDLGEMGLRWF